MALTFAQIRSEVAAYMNRTEASFVIGSVDILKRAVNKARKSAEMRRNFELCRLSVKVPSVSLSTGGSLDTAVDNADGVTAVNVKLVERAFLQLNGSGDTVPVEFNSRNYHIQRLRRRYDDITSTSDVTPAQQSVLFQGLTVVQQGRTVYVSPPNSIQFGGASTIPVFFDAVRWRPDYSADADTDFFLDHCTEYILYRSIYQLNLHLKEDQRVAVSAAALADAWAAVVEWDKSLIAGTVDDFSLD